MTTTGIQTPTNSTKKMKMIYPWSKSSSNRNGWSLQALARRRLRNYKNDSSNRRQNNVTGFKRSFNLKQRSKESRMKHRICVLKTIRNRLSSNNVFSKCIQLTRKWLDSYLRSIIATNNKWTKTKNLRCSYHKCSNSMRTWSLGLTNLNARLIQGSKNNGNKRRQDLHAARVTHWWAPWPNCKGSVTPSRLQTKKLESIKFVSCYFQLREMLMVN